LYCDGAAKSNPVGDAGAGGVLYDCVAPPSLLPGDEAAEVDLLLRQHHRPPVASFKRYLGVRSSVEAEYDALILGLRTALNQGVTHLTVRMDSELVVKHMAGEYAVRAENLKPLHHAALTLAAQFQQINVQHVRRHLNAEADALANEVVQEGRAARLNQH
jgi:ribonuclease HI